MIKPSNNYEYHHNGGSDDNKSNGIVYMMNNPYIYPMGLHEHSSPSTQSIQSIHNNNTTSFIHQDDDMNNSQRQLESLQPSLNDGVQDNLNINNFDRINSIQHCLPCKKRKAKSSPPFSSTIQQSTQQEQQQGFEMIGKRSNKSQTTIKTTTTTPKKKKRKINTHSSSSSSLSTLVLTNTEITSDHSHHSSITTITPPPIKVSTLDCKDNDKLIPKVKSSQLSKNMGWKGGLQTIDHKTLIEFINCFSNLDIDIDNHESMMIGVNALSNGFKGDFLKALVVSCKKYKFKYGTSLWATKSQIATQLILRRNELLTSNILYQLSNDLLMDNINHSNETLNNTIHNTINNTNNNTIVHCINVGGIDNINSEGNLFEELGHHVTQLSSSLNQELSNNDHTDMVSPIVSHDHTILNNDMINDSFIDGCTTTTTTNSVGQFNQNNTTINTSTPHTYTTHTNNNNTSSLNNNGTTLSGVTVDDSFNFYDLLDSSQQQEQSQQGETAATVIVDSYVFHRSDEFVIHLMKQLVEKDQHIEHMTRMYESQLVSNRKLLEFFKDFKINLNSHLFPTCMNHVQHLNTQATDSNNTPPFQ